MYYFCCNTIYLFVVVLPICFLLQQILFLFLFHFTRFYVVDMSCNIDHSTAPPAAQTAAEAKGKLKKKCGIKSFDRKQRNKKQSRREKLLAKLNVEYHE